MAIGVLASMPEIPSPTGVVSVQPSDGETPVNLPTILSTSDTTLDQTITLLGDPIRVNNGPCQGILASTTTMGPATRISVIEAIPLRVD